MTHNAFPFDGIDVASGVDVVDVDNVLILLLLSSSALCLFSCILLILVRIKSSAVLFS